MKTLKAYLNSMVEAPSQQPLFDITTKEFREILEDLRQLAGIKSQITPHCFRVGGATWASKQGWSEARIQLHRRWKSGAHRIYIRSY